VFSLRLITGFLISLFLCVPTLQASAASQMISLSQLGYSQDITVKGSTTQTSFYFPLPKADIQGTSSLSLYLEPSAYLNAGSTFTIFLNDQAAASFTAGQLRQNPLVKLSLPTGAIAARGLSVRINTGMFTSNELCVDYRRGYLFYTLRNQSNLMLNLTPPVPKTIPDFFAGLYQGLAVVLPEAPTREEIAAGIWLYAALQKSYQYQNIQLIIGKPQVLPANLPQIWLAQRSRLPQNLQSPLDNLYLAKPDTLVVTATEVSDLSQITRQLLSLPAFTALPATRSTVNVSGQAPNASFQDRIYFGNFAAQEGISMVAMDFPVYPSQLSALPKSLGIHLEGHYSPSPINGRPVRLDAFFNHNLIHSEVLDNTGVLNKDINLPENINLKARNQLSLQLSYPEGENDCAVLGPLENAQISSSSYYVGTRSLNRERLTWDSVGMLFNRSGIILLEDNPTAELIKAAAQAMVFLNSQLPENQFCTPEIRFLSEYKAPIATDYILILVENGILPEDLAKGLPLQFGQSSTVFQTGGQTSKFTYQSGSAVVVGQIGQYQGIPMIVFHSLQAAQKFSEALYTLVKSFESGTPGGNIYIYNDFPAFSSTLPPGTPERQGLTRFFSLPWNLYEQAYRLAGDYYRFLFLAILVLLAFLVFRSMAYSRKKRKQ